jgi:hypothetical protein
MDYLVSLVEKPLIPTLDFFKLFTTIGNFFGEAFPIIQEKNPELMAKMMAMAGQLDEAAERARDTGYPNL